MTSINKLYINIGGTSRSGSTLLGKIIANDKLGLNLGEIRAVFHPTRIHHKIFIKEIQNSKNIWFSVFYGDKTSYPKNVFKVFPKKRFLVDSSKNPFWINKINKLSNSNNIDCKNILIYKDPIDFAYSILKRGGTNWVKKYINYHKKYFTEIENFYVISFTSLTNSEESLFKLCEWLGIKNFYEKSNYWQNKSFPGFFGSSTPNKNNTIRKPKVPKEFKSKINLELNENRELNQIWEFLKRHDGKVVEKSDNFKYGRVMISFLKLKNKLRLLYRNLNPENYFKNQK